MADGRNDRRHAVVAYLLLASLAALVGCSSKGVGKADLDMYLKARDLYFKGSVDEAALIVSRLSTKDGSFHQAKLLEGKIAFFKNDAPTAERIFGELTRRRPGYTECQRRFKFAGFSRRDFAGFPSEISRNQRSRHVAFPSCDMNQLSN